MRYQKSNTAVEKITSKIHKQFRHNRLALFDEMNVLQVRKHVNKLYKSVLNSIITEFVAVANSIYQDIYDECLALGFDGDPTNIDEAWIEEFFDRYNPVTKYVFSNEIDRKRARLFEALVANELDTFRSYKDAERLITQQVRQYGIDLEDAIAMTVYEDTGVKKVQWVAEDDHKTCGVCNELDGQIFKLKDAPPKQHYNCRCYLIPVKE